MPKSYEKMRDKFIKDGMSKKAAQAKAARIYNAKHKVPVTKVHKRGKGGGGSSQR